MQFIAPAKCFQCHAIINKATNGFTKYSYFPSVEICKAETGRLSGHLNSTIQQAFPRIVHVLTCAYWGRRRCRCKWLISQRKGSGIEKPWRRWSNKSLFLDLGLSRYHWIASLRCKRISSPNWAWWSLLCRFVCGGKSDKPLQEKRL